MFALVLSQDGLGRHVELNCSEAAIELSMIKVRRKFRALKLNECASIGWPTLRFDGVNDGDFIV